MNKKHFGIVFQKTTLSAVSVPLRLIVFIQADGQGF